MAEFVRYVCNYFDSQVPSEYDEESGTGMGDSESSYIYVDQVCQH